MSRKHRAVERAPSALLFQAADPRAQHEVVVVRVEWLLRMPVVESEPERVEAADDAE